MAHGGGGTLTLRTAANSSERTVVVDVADDGPGIPAYAADRVFEPFYSTKREDERPGLGLSIAFGIVVAHGGTLELVPSDRGACFRVTLPAGDA